MAYHTPHEGWQRFTKVADLIRFTSSAHRPVSIKVVETYCLGFRTFESTFTAPRPESTLGLQAYADICKKLAAGAHVFALEEPRHIPSPNMAAE
jgi:hypothetical protein